MSALAPYLLIALGGAAGALARYLTTAGINTLHGTHLPAGTFVVNMAGCFALGIVGGLLDKEVGSSAEPLLRYALAIGFLGSLTTFSTFSFESIRLLESDLWLHAVGYILASVAAGLIFVRLGLMLVISGPAS